MAQNLDRQALLNCLDEIDEYFDTIETFFLALTANAATDSSNAEQMDAILKAAHTIKGIGSMIECPSLSQLSHQFEDSLKILQARRSSIQVDTFLELL